jgi:peptidoglycan/xylan/chitin deacetylase (PgdA/CDA1 family)
VLDLLTRYGASATFFLSGTRAAAHPELVAAIVARGHAVYGHGWEHVHLDRGPRERLGADLTRVENLLARFRPTPTPYLVRLPYNAGFRTPWVHRQIRAWRADAQLVHWAVSLEDVLIPAECTSVAELDQLAATRVARAVGDPRLRGAIVLLHEQPFDIAGPLNPLVAPCLVGHLLSALSSCGIGTTPISPRKSRGVVSRCVLV